MLAKPTWLPGQELRQAITGRRKGGLRMQRYLKAVCGSWVAILLLSCASVSGAGTDSPLIAAAKEGDPAVVRALLTDGADVNATESDGTTALAWAVHRDAVEMAGLLIRAGARSNAANYYGVTPLSLACTNRSAVMVETLLKAGADPNLALSSGETPLLTGAHTGDVRVVKLLLDHGAEVNATEPRLGQTALMWAVAGGHADVVRVLIEAGADVRVASTTGFTPLMFAARYGDVEMARMLVAAGASVNEADADSNTALSVATGSVARSSTGHERVGTFLLEHGADHSLSAKPYGPLHEAAGTGKAELAQALLAHGADPNARATGRGSAGGARISKGATPFWVAASKVDVHLVRMLVAAGADSALTPEDGTTALMTAAGIGQVEGPRAGAFASPYRTRWDETRALEVVALLLDHGADINAVNKKRTWTALHGAAHIGADRMVRFLVERGATVDVKGKNGQTAWSLAAEGFRDEITRTPHESTADLLLALGADPEARDPPTEDATAGH